jgi:phosphoadenosine phosphosulfate reductase
MLSCDACDVGPSAGQIVPHADKGLTQLQSEYGHLSADALLRAMIRDEFRERIVVVSSFGAESAVILSRVAEIDPATPVTFLDTGRHFAETLAYRDQLASHLGLTDVRTVHPVAKPLVSEDVDGQLWQRDGDRCCHLRKVLPLERALEGYRAWITGRKRYHGGQRTELPTIESVDSRIKINPLARWTLDQIAAEFRSRNLPAHPLIAQGYLSIGCAPCTSPVAIGVGVRDGRWTDTSKTECGIHRVRWANS